MIDFLVISPFEWLVLLLCLFGLAFVILIIDYLMPY